MLVYLVRLKDNHEVVGIFSVERKQDLAEFVDECTDPWSCECTKLPAGGIMWPKPGACPVPMPALDDEDADEDADVAANEEAQEFSFDGADLSEYWLDHFYEYGSSPKWRDVTEVGLPDHMADIAANRPDIAKMMGWRTPAVQQIEATPEGKEALKRAMRATMEAHATALAAAEPALDPLPDPGTESVH